MEKEKMTKLEKQWVLYDVGNSAFVMLVSTIIPIYFKNMATASGISAANATAYGKDVGISDSSMLLALLLTQVVAFPCSSLFGKLARKYESEKLISVCIGAYFLIALILWFVYPLNRQAVEENTKLLSEKRKKEAEGDVACRRET